MTNEQILKAAFIKAGDIGFDTVKGADVEVSGSLVKPYDDEDVWINAEALIFDHSFAKAFWGEESGLILEGDNNPDCAGERMGKLWQYHLQQMVLEENPIQYLEKFL